MEKKTRRKVSRREFIKTGAAGLGVATLGSLPQKVFGAAPAVIKGTKLSLLQATYFIAPAQDLFKKQVADWGKMAGVETTVDFLNWPDLQPKIAAAVQAGGVDLVDLWPGWNFLYRNNLVDLSKEAEEVGKHGGGYEPYVLNSGKVAGKWLGIPNGYSNASMAYRISLFKEAEVANAEDGNKIDLTWDQYFAIAKKLKAKGKPFGQALGHSTGDPPGFCYPYMWSNGAMELSKDLKSIAFNKPEFVDAMKKFVQAWKDGYDETGTSWDDSNNNRAYLSEHVSALAPFAQERIATLQGFFQMRGLDSAGALDAAHRALSGALQVQSMALAFEDSYRFIGAVCLVSIPLIFFLGRGLALPQAPGAWARGPQQGAHAIMPPPGRSPVALQEES
jgi:multiple sugar transport system substrate-binding protein